MKKILVLFAVVIMFGMSSCSWVSPNWNKAETEKKQLQELKKHTVEMQKQTTYDSTRVELMKEQNKILNKLVD